jgi:DNA-binding NarL/FixJ family response regulator
MTTSLPHPSRDAMAPSSPAFCPARDAQPWRMSDPPLTELQTQLSAILALARETIVRCEQAVALVLTLSNNTIGVVPLGATPVVKRFTELESAIGVRLPMRSDSLTARELEVLRLIAAAVSNRQIAETLFISPRTIERHIANIYLKLDVHCKAEATTYARCHHLV